MRTHTLLLSPRLLLGLLAAAALPAAAGPGHAHQHGVASLQVVVDGDTLAVTLDSPLDNLLGFERAPRTEAERNAVRAMAQRWHAGAALAQPTAAAGCVLQGAELQSEVLAPALLAPAGGVAATPAPAAAAKPGAETHADLQATLRYRCSQPQALRSVALGGLFSAFPRLRQVDAALVAPGVQRGAKLSARQPQLAW